MDPLIKVQSSQLIDPKLKKKIISKLPTVQKEVKTIEEQTGIGYPVYYIEPTLRVMETTDNMGGLGILYARTIPVEIQGKVVVLVELSAPIVVYGLKTTIRSVLAHEFLHYVDLVMRFSRLAISSAQGGASVFEEQFADMERTVEPRLVFKDRAFARQISKKTNAGLHDSKLDEKCRANWLDEGLPTVRVSMGKNQAKISIEAILRSSFDPKITNLVPTYAS